jgi:hypothetical protein
MKDDGSPFWMLIDCGVHTGVKGGSQKIVEIVDNIYSVTQRLDVIVITHEHVDHISGFTTAAEKFAQFTVGEIWMAWTENPEDAQASALDKYKESALAALQATSHALDGGAGATAHLSALRDGLQSVLGFQFGAKGDRVRSMRDAVVELTPNKTPRYLEPKDAPLSIKHVPNLRIYVLGPPRDPNLIKVLERPSEMYGMSPVHGWSIAQALSNGFAVREGTLNIDSDHTAPFDAATGMDLSYVFDPQSGPDEDIDQPLLNFARTHYLGIPSPTAGSQKDDQKWRRIDLDWLTASSDLAIQLDKKTNNSSLVLAFEFIDSGRVMLFVGDAQVGNWLSWQDVKWRVGDATVTGPELLARTIFYKVGHHGSHNATLKQKGLELMTSPDMTAFIPTNEKDAKNIKWGEMPFHDIVTDLSARTSGRVIRADDPWLSTPNPPAGLATPSGSIKGLRHAPDGLWVELDIG